MIFYMRVTHLSIRGEIISICILIGRPAIGVLVVVAADISG